MIVRFTKSNQHDSLRIQYPSTEPYISYPTCDKRTAVVQARTLDPTEFSCHPRECGDPVFTPSNFFLNLRLHETIYFSQITNYDLQIIIILKIPI